MLSDLCKVEVQEKLCDIMETEIVGTSKNVSPSNQLPYVIDSAMG